MMSIYVQTFSLSTNVFDSCYDLHLKKIKISSFFSAVFYSVKIKKGQSAAFGRLWYCPKVWKGYQRKFIDIRRQITHTLLTCVIPIRSCKISSIWILRIFMDWLRVRSFKRFGLGGSSIWVVGIGALCL